MFARQLDVKELVAHEIRHGTIERAFAESEVGYMRIVYGNIL